MYVGLLCKLKCICIVLAMPFGRKKRTWGFGYDVCPVCFDSFGTKHQNIGDISQQPLLLFMCTTTGR
jgi:hypothetical protein